MEEMVLLQLMQGFFNARGHGFRQRRKSEQKKFYVPAQLLQNHFKAGSME